MWLYNRLLPVPYSRKWNDGVYLHVYIILPKRDLSTIKEQMFEQMRLFWSFRPEWRKPPLYLTLPFVIQDERSIRPLWRKPHPIYSQIIPARKIEKIPTKREKDIIEQFRNWCNIVMNQRKTLKFMRLLRLRRKIYGKNSQTNIQLWYCREQSAHQIGIQSYRMWHRRQRWTAIHCIQIIEIILWCQGSDPIQSKICSVKSPRYVYRQKFVATLYV